LRIAAGDTACGQSGGVSASREETMQEVQQIVGILPGDVEADDEVDGALAQNNRPFPK
jgi:hypothetical protein